MNKLSRHFSTLYKTVPFKTLIPVTSNVNSSHNEIFSGYRKIHESKCSVLLTCLKSRGLIRLHGNDATDFLQGLVTNDVHELMRQGSSIQYTFMLNVQGRILYDLFLYNMTEKGGTPTVFVDVPKSAVEEFISLLKRYKLRKKVDISNISDEFKVWSQFALHVEENAKFNSETSPTETVISCPDPRVADFGRRLIRRTCNDDATDNVEESVYRESRFKWGLAEGMDDLPPGNCFPLESNGGFVNAVSFDKGCYIGQELTARTHHTGVTRKRLMPLVFESSPPDIDKDTTIQTEKGRNAGKFRGSQDRYGLGLIRMAHIKEKLFVTASDKSQVSLQTHVPHWWPEFDSN